jgi:3-phenylpropionate/trans-cinnamate dioxygenase ferredoxin subunit
MTSSRFKLGAANFTEGEMRGYEVGRRNVLVALLDGEYRALDDWCNHAGCLLSAGRIEEKMVVCPCHEVGFDLVTGKNLTSPGVCDDQPTVKVVVENGELYVEGFGHGR